MAFENFTKQFGSTPSKQPDATAKPFSGFIKDFGGSQVNMIDAPASIPAPVETPKSGGFADVASSLSEKLNQASYKIDNATANLSKYNEDPNYKPNLFKDTLREIGSLENLPLGIGEIIKQARQDPETVASLTASDFGQGIIDTAKEVVKYPVSAVLTVGSGLVAPILAATGVDSTGLPVSFDIPGLGKVSNLQARAVERVQNGESPLAVAITSTPDAIFDTLFILGVGQKLTGPRPVTVAKGELPANSGAKVTEPVKSFRAYTEPTATQYLTPEAMQKIALEKGIDFGPKYDPNLPSYFRLTGKANGVITGEIIQVKPSYFDTFMSKLKGDATKVPPENINSLYQQETSVQQIASAKKEGAVATDVVAKGPQTMSADKIKMAEYYPTMGKDLPLSDAEFATIVKDNPTLVQMVKDGKAPPIPVREISKGQFEPDADGATRLIIYKHLGIKDIPVEVTNTMPVVKGQNVKMPASPEAGVVPVVPQKPMGIVETLKAMESKPDTTIKTDTKGGKEVILNPVNDGLKHAEGLQPLFKRAFEIEKQFADSNLLIDEKNQKTVELLKKETGISDDVANFVYEKMGSLVESKVDNLAEFSKQFETDKDGNIIIQNSYKTTPAEYKSMTPADEKKVSELENQYKIVRAKGGPDVDEKLSAIAKEIGTIKANAEYTPVKKGEFYVDDNGSVVKAVSSNIESMAKGDDWNAGFVRIQHVGDKNNELGTMGYANKLRPATPKEIKDAQEFVPKSQSFIPTQKQRVAEAVKNGPKKIKQIAEETKIKEPNVRRILGVGAKEGTFERVSEGVYKLNVDGKDMAYVEVGNAIESLPRLAKEGFKADMVFLDIPYNTPAVKGGNRGAKYDLISVKDFGIVLDAIKDISKTSDTPVIHMFSNAKSGLDAMNKYNDLFLEKGFVPVGKGEYSKTYKDGKAVGFPTSKGFMTTEPEGIIVFTQSGNLAKDLGSLNFKLVRPSGYQTEKPEEMLRQMIEMTTEEGDTILDPFAGSGSTGAAAVKSGRKAYLIEKNAKVAEETTMPRVENALELKGTTEIGDPAFNRTDFLKLTHNKEFMDKPQLKVEFVTYEKNIANTYSSPRYVSTTDKFLTFKGEKTSFMLKPEAMGLNADNLKAGDVIDVDVKSMRTKGATKQLRVTRGGTSFAMAQYNPKDLPRATGKLGGIHNIKPVEMPELVRLTRELMGNFPTVVKKTGNAAGRFTAEGNGQIKLIASLFNDEANTVNQAARVLAHEIGHLVDYLPEGSMQRGNLLGRLFTLKKFFKSTFNTETGEALDLKAIRTEALNEVLASKEKTFKDYISDKTLRESIKDEVKNLFDEKVSETGAIQNPIVKKELLAVTRYWHPYDPKSVPASYKAYRESPEELYADALSVLFNDPGKLEELAPTFYKEFFNALDNKPDVKVAFFSAQELLNGTPEQLFKARMEDVRNGFERAEDIQRGFRDKAKLSVRALWERLRQQVDDVNYPILKKQRQAEASGKIFSEEENPAFALEEQSLADNENFLLVDKIDKNIAKPIKDAGMSLEDFGEYLLLDRIRTGRADIANPFGFNPKNANEQLDYLKNTVVGPENFKLLQKKAQEFHDLVFPSIEEAVKTGAYNTETFNTTILPNKDNYAAFQVVDYMQERMPAGIRAQVGTLKEVANPFTATILKTVALNRLNAYQRAKNATIKMLQSMDPGEISETRRITSDGKMSMFKPAEGKGNIEVLEDGKMQSYDVDPYIAESFNKMKVGDLNVIVELIDKFGNKIFKPVVTSFNLGFVLGTNPIRDFRRNYKLIPNATIGSLLKEYFNAVPEALKYAKGDLDEFTRSLVESKAINSPMTDYNFDPVDTEFSSILEKYGLIKASKPLDNKALEKLRLTVARPVIQILEGIKFLANTTEIMSKIAGAKTRIAGGESGSQLAYNIRNFTGTPNYRNKGTGTRTTNAVFTFSNIIKEGLKTDFRIATNPNTRGGYWWKTVKIDLLPKFLMFLAASGVLGKEIEDLMNKATEYDKTNYTVIPVGSYNGKAVYVRIPHDESGRLVSATFWKLANAVKNGGDTKDLQDIFALGAGQFPGMSPVIDIVSQWAQFLAGKNPYDSFRGRNIIDDTTWQAGGGAALKKMVQWTLSDLGLAKFSTYDASNKTGVETFMQIAPWFSSLIKISDYGEQEKLKDVMNKQKTLEARQLIKTSNAINKYVPQAVDDRANITDYVKKVVTESIGPVPTDAKDIPEYADKAKNVINKFTNAMLKGSINDPVAQAIGSATSNEQKAKMLEYVQADKTKDEFRTLLIDLLGSKTINTDVIKKLDLKKEEVSMKSSAGKLLGLLTGAKTASASELEDPTYSYTKDSKSFFRRLIEGDTYTYTKRTQEQVGEVLASRGQAVPAEFTMYNPQKKQTDSTPTIMASGKKIYSGAIATSDYSMPLGTKVYVPELKKTFVVEDRMNRRYSPDKYGKVVFDVLNTEATSSAVKEAKNFGRKQMTFVVVGHDGRSETKAE